MLSYTIYKSEIHWGGTERAYYLKYYIFALALTVFSIVNFFLKNETKIYVVIYTVCAIFALYLFEGYMVYSSSPASMLKKKSQAYERTSDKPFDKRTPYQILMDKKADPDTVLVISPQHHLKDGENITLFTCLVSPTKQFIATKMVYSGYTSDRYGFNNPNAEWDKVAIDYLLIGDSFTHGACVDRPFDIASNLRNFSGKSVLNLGFAGNGPLAEYATLKEYYNPKIKKIVWIYFEGNDIGDLQRELKIKTLERYIKDKDFKQNLINKQPMIDKSIREMLQKFQASIAMKKKINFNYLKIINFIKLTETRKVISKDLPKNTNKKIEKLSKDYLFEILKSVKSFAMKMIRVVFCLFARICRLQI